MLKISPALQRVLIILTASIMFGLYPPASRGAYADGANGTFIIWLTTFMRATMLTGFCLITGNKLFSNREDTINSIRSGIVQSISIAGILGSLAFLSGPVAVVLLFTNTLMLLVFLWIKKELQINKWLLVTTLSCLLGITFVVDVWHAKSSTEITGYVLIMIGAIATASRLYIFGKLTQRRNPAVVGAETFICALAFLLLLAFYQMPIPPHTWGGIGWAILSGLSLSLGSFAMFYAIAKVGSFHFSLYNKLEPVFTALFSALLIGEILNWYQYFGMAIVIISLVTYQIWDHHNKTKAAR